MKKTFLASVAAAALVITTGLASAQGQGPGSTSGASGASPSAPQAAPPASTSGQSGSGTLNRSDSPSSMDNMKSDKASPGDRAQDNSKQPSGSKAAQDNKMAPAAPKSATDSQTPSSSKSATDSQTKQSTTTGQAGAGAKITTEQRTQITTVIKQQNVKPVTNVNFSISVGAKVPRGSVTFHALPAQVVTIYPEWRGYEYILVGSEIIVVNPRTLEIVAIIDA